MKKPILERYERHTDNRILIDIAADRMDDLYNHYDKQANFLKKDLDEAFAQYLAESVREIGSEPFVIRISLKQPPESEVAAKLTQSIRNYFHYMKELEIRKLNEKIRTSLILFMIGIVVLTLSILTGQHNETDGSVIIDLLAEGLMVAAWVSLWESLATFLIHWAPLKRSIKLYESIAESEVAFN